MPARALLIIISAAVAGVAAVLSLGYFTLSIYPPATVPVTMVASAALAGFMLVLGATLAAMERRREQRGGR